MAAVAQVSGASFPIVGIGASAGGLESFKLLLDHLPPSTGMAFVFIQHLHPKHLSFLGEALGRATKMVVAQVTDQTLVVPDHVYVIPPNADITIGDGRLSLTARPEDNRPHLPIDSFFESLAAERGSQAIGVVLSGSASDGTEGLKAIKAAHGITFVQDPNSAKFPGMPRSAVEAGVADHSLAIPELAEALVRLSNHSYLGKGEAPATGGNRAARTELFQTIRDTVGIDFTDYKPATLERRLARRMALRGTEDLPAYVACLKSEPSEVHLLFEDLLVHVTSFFRDPHVFDALKLEVFPEILKHKEASDTIRMWVAGCSTGEEIYSLAMCLLEHLGDTARPIQIFGSDASDKAIEKARAGVYSEGAMRNVTEERRRRFFTRVERGHRIAKAVRDRCVFVQHDLDRDPPFSKMDLVSCRNVLIYFDAPLQKRVLSKFHYALRRPGFLVLGRSESLTGASQLFTPVDRTDKIFGRTAQPSLLRFAGPAPARLRGPSPPDDAAEEVKTLATMDANKYLDRLILGRYAPPGVLVDDKLRILQFRGQTGAYLQAPPGEPQRDLLQMLRPGLLAPLRSAIAEARRSASPVRRDRVEVEYDGAGTICDLVVLPYAGPPGAKQQQLVILFESPPAVAGKTKGVKGAKRKPARTVEPRRQQSRLAKLEQELEATQEYLLSLKEEHVLTNDDLGAANEELTSGNEELQSMNEELETAKEELQSINEELTTVNDELHTRNQEVNQVNSDLVNLVGTVDIPILILDHGGRIRRFTPKARSLLNVVATDIGRAFSDIRPNIVVDDLQAQIADVIETMAVKESEIRDTDGHWYRLQIRPYRTLDDKIDGAILSLVDIDALKHLLADSHAARTEAERANRAKDQFLAVLSHELRSPLSSMLLQAQLLRESTTDPARIRRASEAIERGTKVQVQLIDDLLDVSRIINGKLKMESTLVDLRAVIRAAIDGVSANAARKSIAISVALDEVIGQVTGDFTRLQQVISNLLTNAIKFTPEHGRVALSAAVEGNQARLTVSDTGIGIEAAFLPQVFTRFAQEDSSTTRNYGGLGLGLAIVRYIAEAHGGSVRASSAGKGQGATFTVDLPLTSLEAIASSPPIGKEDGLDPESPLRDVRVLFIDDDAAAGDAVAHLLRQRGAHIAVANSAVEARAVVELFRPDVVVCDIVMPGEDGYSFIRRLRKLGPAHGGAVAALALTALSTEPDRQRALAAGFQMHLTKPVKIERLTAVIGSLAVRPQSSSPPGGRAA